MNQVGQIKEWLGTGSINVFGLPFAGKDTQGERLAEMLGGALIGGGDILRHYHDQEKISAIVASGKLFPSELYMDIVTPYFAREEIKHQPLILSSVGRWHGEEQSILEASIESGHPMKAVVMLQLTEEEVWKRFRKAQETRDRGMRRDDNEESLRVRLDEFAEKTAPVLEFYRGKGLLVEVDGSLSRDEVTQAIFAGLTEFSAK